MIQFKGKNYMTIEELADYLPENPTIPTIYSWTKHKQIPFIKFGRRLYFEKEQVDNWNENGRPNSRNYDKQQ